MVRLHEDPSHACTGPVGLQKTRQRGIVASKARGRSDGELQFIPESHERGSPKWSGNGLPMVLAFEGTERLDTDLKERAIYIIKS